MLILHYTGVATAAGAIDWLSRAESKVSAHYVIDEAGRITQLVAEEMRAWHAGLACWDGRDRHQFGLRSASRSTIPVTSRAIRTSPMRRSSA